MTDTPTPNLPGEPPAAAAPTPPPSGLWHRYRAMPMWLQILIPVLIVAIIVLLIVALSSSGDDDGATSATTVPSGDSIDDVMKGLIIVGGVTGTSTTTTSTTALETTTTVAETTTVETTTTAAPTTVPSPSTTSAGVVSPTTAAPATTSAPTTTGAPATTDAPATTTTVPAAAALPTVADFVSQWNSAVARTNVPEISESQATVLTGDYAGYFLVTLAPVRGSKLPAQVGLIAQLTAPESGQLAKVMLVWIPGADEASSDFYWESFGVLTQAVTPGTTADQTAAIESALGKETGMPPFTTSATTTSDSGNTYSLFSQPYDSATAGPIDVSAISVS